MVALARQRVPRAAGDRRSEDRPRRRGPHRAAAQAVQDAGRVRALHRGRMPAWIPNYGRALPLRRRSISNAFVESAVNQVISKRMVKEQQMRWSPTRCAPPTPDPHPSPQRRSRAHLPTLVSRTHASSRRAAPCGVNLPRFVPLSWHSPRPCSRKAQRGSQPYRPWRGLGVGPGLSAPSSRQTLPVPEPPSHIRPQRLVRVSRL